jgi:hypothetical protein
LVVAPPLKAFPVKAWVVEVDLGAYRAVEAYQPREVPFVEAYRAAVGAYQEREVPFVEAHMEAKLAASTFVLEACAKLP